MKKLPLFVIIVVVANAWNCFSATVETPMVQDLDSNEYSITNVDEISAETIFAEDAVLKGPWVDVRAFGAKGDNVTDDTTAIQNAIDSGAAGIFIPEGIFMVSGITLNENQTLFGLGIKSELRLLSGNPNGKIVEVDGNNITLQNLYINNEDNTPQSLYGISIISSCSTRIINVWISGAANGLFLSDTAGVTASNLNINDCSISGIRLYGSEGSISVCNFSNIFISGCAIGVYATGAVSVNSFQNINAESCSESGFWFYGSYFNTINGCTAYQNGQHGFKISAAAQSNTFDGCMALENSVETAGSYNGFCIINNLTQNNLISGCIAIDSRGANATQKYGIYIEAPASNNIITGNTLSPNKTGALYEYGQTATNIGHNFTDSTVEKHSGFEATGYISLLSTNGNVGSLSFSATSTIFVSNTSVTANSKVLLSPTSASAANLVSSSKSPYVSTLVPGRGFNVSTANNTAALGTETFNYVIFN